MSEAPRKPVIGDELEAAGGSRGEAADQLRAFVRGALAQAREGAQAKEAELWARYHALTKARRQR